VAQYNFLPIFLLYPLLMITAFCAASALYSLARKGKLNKFAAFVLVAAAFLMVPIVEAANDASRAPYMVITGNTGLPANAFANTMIPISWSIAELAVTIAVVVMSTFLLGIYFIYKVKTGPITEETI